MKKTTMDKWALLFDGKEWGWQLANKKGDLIEEYFAYDDKQSAIDDFKEMAEYRGYEVI